ncbi:MAG TPA: hypothetical protein VJ417_02970 [Candidatus Glassbacteria bacterium]|nr:hypothetical protein [Candidatus Glassbacteria bacterium]
MKTYVENFLIGLLIAFAVAFVSAMGWIIWVKTGDPYTTALTVVMMVWFFYLSPSIRMPESAKRKAAQARMEKSDAALGLTGGEKLSGSAVRH